MPISEADAYLLAWLLRRDEALEAREPIQYSAGRWLNPRFGQKVAETLRQVGHTAASQAELTGVSQEEVETWLSGQTPERAEDLIRFCRVFHLAEGPWLMLVKLPGLPDSPAEYLVRHLARLAVKHPSQAIPFPRNEEMIYDLRHITWSSVEQVVLDLLRRAERTELPPAERPDPELD